MRVLIDSSPTLLRSAGIKNYVYHWVRSLQRIAEPGSIRAFPFLANLDPAKGGLNHEASLLSPWATWPRLALLYAVNIPWLPALDWATRGADIFHASNQVRQKPPNIKVTATLHDMTCWLMPQFHTAANVRADKTFAANVVSHADGVIAISENTRRDAIEILGLKPERVRVIHNGVADPYFDAPPLPPGSYGLDKPYILFIGTLEPRKNLRTLLEAYRQLPPSTRETFDLAIAGPSGWGDQGGMGGLAAVTPGVRLLGYVPERDLPGLTAGAVVFAYPSLYEGFGFPVAQAMAARVPVLTSETSCLPEIAGDGALYVDPSSASAISAALDRLLGSPDLRATVAGAGRLQAEKYRWDACAQRSLEFFRQVAEE